MTRRFYVDTSAYLCVLLGEKGHREISRELRGAQLLSSVLLVLESNRNLVRLSREGILRSEDLATALAAVERDRRKFVLRELSIDLCGSSPFPIVTTPRSLDLVHLRTAAWFHERERLTRFVTLDRSQELSAREMQLPV